MADAWDWALGKKRLNGQRHRTNGHWVKEFEKHYPAIFLVLLATLSAGLSGYYFGINTGEPLTGYTPPTEKHPPIEAVGIDTVETEITNSETYNGNVMFEFNGRGINQTTIVAGYECRINFGEFHGCQSPFTLFDLTDNEYTFEVAAVDTNGNVDNTPAAEVVTVK